MRTILLARATTTTFAWHPMSNSSTKRTQRWYTRRNEPFDKAMILLSYRVARYNPFLGTTIPAHDPEKWLAIFGKDHAPFIGRIPE
jgi:hypothetical protein